MAPLYHFSTTQALPITIERAWQFFSSPKNLARITPPYMRFTMLDQLDAKEIYEGMLINYTVSPLFGIPLHWQTEIGRLQKPLFFTDRQRKGPYTVWEHTHTFTAQHGGVLMKDEVAYSLPFGIAGRLAHALLVRKRIENIFDYRRETLKNIFESHGNNNH